MSLQPHPSPIAAQPHVLAVDDDPTVLGLIRAVLESAGLRVVGVEDPLAFWDTLQATNPDLLILDIELPKVDGIQLCRAVRAEPRWAQLPILFVTGRTDPDTVQRVYVAGADDFVAKPFSYSELRLRIGAVLRRTREQRGHGRLRVGELELDPAAREVRLRGRRIDLSQKEFALLRALAAEPTRVLTKEELLRDVWGFRSLGTTRTLDSHACRLRQKLGAEGDRFVVNVWGVGYRLIDGPLHQEEERWLRDPAA
jgi:DNA-binding response OmpR family regulator